MVCCGTVNRLNRSCTINYWKQIFWYQFIASPHLCFVRACHIPFFKYDWKKEVWNLFFVFGILLGGVIAINLLSNPNPIEVNPKLATELAGYGITN